MFQRITIAGYLGGDPVLRYLPDGTSVANLSVATNRRWTDTQGEDVEETVWFRVSVWGGQAEAVNQYLTKGSKVLVEGRLRADPETGAPRLYTRRDGTVGTSFEIVATTVRFLDSQSDSSTSVEQEGLEDIPI